MNNLQTLSRQDLTRLACDTLAADGKKPSIGLVREWTIQHAGAKRGSDGDVQKDITQWFDDLLKLKRDKAVADLPDGVAALARDFWRLAVDSANDSLAAEREKLTAEKASLEKMVDLAQEDTMAAIEIANQLKGKLALANETIAGRDDAIKRLEESLSESRATLAAKDERIAVLSDELARKAQDHAAGLAELDGLRKHSLLEIDRAREETRSWRVRYETLDAEHRSAAQASQQKTSALETELAGVRGRLSGIEEALAAAHKRAQGLEAELAVAKAQPTAATPVTGSKRFGAGKRAALVHKRL